MNASILLANILMKAILYSLALRKVIVSRENDEKVVNHQISL